MSYVKNEWGTGDVITAEKLNHIEDGVANAGGGGGGSSALILTFDPTDVTGTISGATAKEVLDAFWSGTTVIIQGSTGSDFLCMGAITVTKTRGSGGTDIYQLITFTGNSPTILYANGDDSYFKMNL